MSSNTFKYGEDRLSAGVALELARDKRKGFFTKNVIDRINMSRQYVKNIVHQKKIVYGINTGFGPLCTTIISENDTEKLQSNILISHSVGVGNPLPAEIVKLMLILKVQALAQGYSGVALETLERILWHIEHHVLPVVPSQGSVGASGDLAPLSHLFLPLIGRGQVLYKGEIMETGEMFQQENLQSLTLGPKEGLALINGTQLITAYTVSVLARFQNCLDAADIVGAMTLESLLGSVKPFQEKLHEIRPFPGIKHVAHRLRCLLRGSEMVESHTDCNRVQDPYSLRCMPQVHGSSRNAWLHLKELASIEINAVTDNPVILDDQTTISGGNFHGQPLALPLDYVTIAISELGNISDRRVYMLLEGGVEGLPRLLMKDTGINSGFMIAQYTSAALVSENKSLCFPASADSIPTSLGQEDHVSMGAISARKASQVLDNLENILAVELVSAAQAFDFRRPLKSSSILEGCHHLIREHIDHAETDRIFAEDIQTAHELIVSNRLVHTANENAASEGINLDGEYHELFGIY
jgi:histidine ammonia-lyase